MIYLTGDTHGGIDLRKLTDKRLLGLSRQDYVIICGDFGFIYNWKKESRKERSWLKWFERQPYTLLFVDGNHECFPRLYDYPEIKWHGGKVHVIRDNVMHLMRGEIFDLDGNTIFAMGGARSHDRGPVAGDTKAVEGRFWWPQEIPDEAEMQHGMDNLAAHGSHVDYIVTHCLPGSLQQRIKPAFGIDPLNTYLEQIMASTTYTHWYCGHYHIDQDQPHNISVLFNRLVELGETVSASLPRAGEPIYRRDNRVGFFQDGKYTEGMITGIYPWGKARVKDQPVYDINVNGIVVPYVKESDIAGYGREE